MKRLTVFCSSVFLAFVRPKGPACDRWAREADLIPRPGLACLLGRLEGDWSHWELQHLWKKHAVRLAQRPECDLVPLSQVNSTLSGSSLLLTHSPTNS